MISVDRSESTTEPMVVINDDEMTGILRGTGVRFVDPDYYAEIMAIAGDRLRSQLNTASTGVNQFDRISTVYTDENSRLLDGVVNTILDNSSSGT